MKKPNEKKIFTTNWYLQKVYFPSTAISQEIKQKREIN